MRRTALLLLAAALAACAGELPAPSGEVHLDLLAAFPATAAAEPTTLLTPADRRHFLQGWEPPAEGAGGEPVLDLAGRGVVWFEAGEKPVDQTLVITTEATLGRVRARPVLVRVNQQPLGTLRLEQGRHQARLALPAARQEPGRNTLDLTAPGGLVRRRGLEPRTRLVLVSLRFEPRVPRPPAPAVRDGRLVLPPGTEVTWFVDVPPDASVVWEGTGTPVRVWVTPDGATGRTPPVRHAGAQAFADLQPEAGRLAGVTLAAETSGNGATVARPRLLGRPPPAPPPASPSTDPATRPSVVLYVADTLRADRLGCYGSTRGATPHLDAFAREGIVFERAVAQSSWTRPAVASLLTGRWPPEHGAASLMAAVRPDLPTLAEILAAAGWTTAGFVTNLNVAPRFGFGRGFARYDYLPEHDDRPEVYATAAELNAAVFPWLAAQGDRPFFLYLHASDPHAPYHPPPAERGRFLPAGTPPDARVEPPFRELQRQPSLATPEDVALLGGLYDGDVAVLDAGFGALMAELRRLGRDRSTLVVFVADHGEEFLEHGGLEHGRTLYGEVTRVPLVVRLPGGADAGRRESRLARQVDVLPTLLAVLGLPPVPGLPGRILLAPDGTAPVEALMETELSSRILAGLVHDPWKVIFDESGGRADRVELYDLPQDPGERMNLAGGRPVVVGYARQAIGRLRLGAGPLPATTVADPATEERLRALGYLE